MDRNQITCLYLKPDAAIPNNPDLPVLIYKHAINTAGPDGATEFEKHFSANGWRGLWRNGIFPYHHFHPDAHEALGIARGRVTVMLGGEAGKKLELEAGDMVVLPAGTGHKRLDASDDLLVVGAYPSGQADYSLCKGPEECPDAKERIRLVSLPETDPLFGKNGPLRHLWQETNPE